MGNESNRRPQSTGRRDSARRAALVKARNKRIILMTVGLCLCLVLVAGIIAGLYLLRKPKDDGKILDNVLVGGVSIGGMTREDAENAIRLSVEPVITGKSMLVRLDNETLELTPAQTGIELDVEDLVEAAYNYGRTGSRMEQNLARAQAKQQSYTIALLPYLRLNLGAIRSAVEEFCDGYNVEMVEPVVTIEGQRPTYRPNSSPVHQILTIVMGSPESILDPNDLYYAILDGYSLMNMEIVYTMPVLVEPEVPDAQEIFDAYCVLPVDATLDPKTYEVTSEVYGYGFNVYNLQRLIDRAEYGETITLTLEFLAPDITAKDLTGSLFQDQLASCTATCNDSTASRNKNLAKACAALNGLVIKPGESFDLSAALGPRTLERGYESAPTYVGSTTSAIGGGIDQVASALYYCALRAGLQVESHSYHRYAVGYTPMGTDAAMGTGENLVFTNTTSDPIRVQAQANGSSVKITLIGTEEKSYVLDIETEIIAQIDPETLYQPMQQDNVYGYKDGDVMQTGLTGYQVVTYLCKYNRSTGALISKTVLAEITYEKRDNIIVKIENTEA